jgi:hypothetical protein
MMRTVLKKSLNSLMTIMLEMFKPLSGQSCLKRGWMQDCKSRLISSTNLVKVSLKLKSYMRVVAGVGVAIGG